MGARNNPEFRSLIAAQSLHSLLSHFKASPIDLTKAFSVYHTTFCASFALLRDPCSTLPKHHEETEGSLNSTHLKQRHESAARLCDAGTATLPECIASTADRPEGLVQLIQLCTETFEDMESINHFPATSNAGFTTVASFNTILLSPANRSKGASGNRRPHSPFRYLHYTLQRNAETCDEGRDEHHAYQRGRRG